MEISGEVGGESQREVTDSIEVDGMDGPRKTGGGDSGKGEYDGKSMGKWSSKSVSGSSVSGSKSSSHGIDGWATSNFARGQERGGIMSCCKFTLVLTSLVFQTGQGEDMYIVKLVVMFVQVVVVEFEMRRRKYTCALKVNPFGVDH